jgi:hypothetical protein
MTEAFDIAIVGGGMVGASLALALQGLDVRTALIEAVPHDAAAQPSFDERTTALSNGSRRILDTLGVWPEVAAVATPIRKIHVSDQGHFGFARIDAAELGLRAIGHVLAPARSPRCARLLSGEGDPGAPGRPFGRAGRLAGAGRRDLDHGAPGGGRRRRAIRRT